MLKRFILWDFARASWQYDIIVALILAFIFLTPRDWFRDQPRIPHASAISNVRSENIGTPYYVDTDLLRDVAEQDWNSKLSEYLQKRNNNKPLHVLRVQPLRNSEGELQGYLAFTRQ